MRRMPACSQACSAADVDLLDRGGIALGGDLGGQVEHRLARGAGDGGGERLLVGQVAGQRLGAGGLRARAPHECDHLVSSLEQLRTGRVSEEATRTGDQDPHALNLLLAPERRGVA